MLRPAGWVAANYLIRCAAVDDLFVRASLVRANPEARIGIAERVAVAGSLECLRVTDVVARRTS